jgi:hypothetical protein
MGSKEVKTRNPEELLPDPRRTARALKHVVYGAGNESFDFAPSKGGQVG